MILDEIPRPVVEYPIVFVKNSETGKSLSVALFGADPEVNLFWRDDRWNSYSVRINIGRQPSFIALADNSPGAHSASGLITCIDIDNPAVQTEVGESLFDEPGKETANFRHKLAHSPSWSTVSSQRSSSSRSRIHLASFGRSSLNCARWAANSENLAHYTQSTNRNFAP